jgi:hypothetical protein
MKFYYDRMYYTALSFSWSITALIVLPARQDSYRSALVMVNGLYS